MTLIKIICISLLIAMVAGCISPSFAAERDAFTVQIDDKTTLKEAKDGSNFAIGNDKDYCTYNFQTKVFTMVEGNRRIVVQLNEDLPQP
ncbi:MAG TPA: hypothetical protein V6C86_14905 [Oculatellaceae cyanobacterium]